MLSISTGCVCLFIMLLQNFNCVTDKPCDDWEYFAIPKSLDVKLVAHDKGTFEFVIKVHLLSASITRTNVLMVHSPRSRGRMPYHSFLTQ